MSERLPKGDRKLCPGTTRGAIHQWPNLMGDPMKFRKKELSLALARAFSAGIVLTLVSTPAAYAQVVDTERSKIEVTVTGTRIPPPNLTAIGAVTLIGADTIKVDGLRSVENLLNNMPQVFADQGGYIANGATGTATVNLRNLGAERTLVLVNGRRLPPGSPLAFPADLNQIPAPLIRRIEILTGGASAIYGSDAVAGVVNFIMNDKFEGVQFEVNQSFYNHQQGNSVASVIERRGRTNPANFQVPGDKSSDGKVFDMNMTLGGNFAGGKGNATIFFNYKKEDALLQSERDFSSCSLGSNAAGFTCAGSSTSFPGRFITAAGSRTVANSAGGTRAFIAANDQYNFGPLNYFQRPSERYGFNAFANYDIAPFAKVYGEFGFHDDRTVAQIAPSGLFGFDASGANALRFENPLLSADFRRDLGLTGPGTTADAIIFRRNVEGGGRQDDLRHTSYRSVIGVKGDFAQHWHYDVFGQSGKVVYQETYKNDFSIARSARALDVVTDPATGQPVCRSALEGTDPACVPYNIFSLGGITPAALAYLSTPGFQKGYTKQTVQGASVSAADLSAYGWKAPWAKDGVAVAFGVERRTEELVLDTDTAFTTGDLAGQGGPTASLSGAYTVKEWFVETRVPLIEQRPFVHLLSVNGSYRYSDYNTGQQTDTYGIGAEWAPVPSTRFRGSYQRAVRAANVVELFEAQTLGLYDNDADPCAGPTPTASLAQCMRTGVTAAQYGTILDSPAGQYNAIFGGNPNLKPEKGDGYTLGWVWTPMRNLSLTVDYFSGKTEGIIGTQPAPIVLSQCLATGDPALCGLITRDRLGTLWALNQAQIVSTNLNLGRGETSGFDIGFNYTHTLPPRWGSVNVDFIGTYLEKFDFEPIPGLGSYDCAGLYGSGTCGTPLPQWRHKLRGTWATPWNVELALTWRHFDSVDFERTSSDPQLAGAFNEVDKTLGARDYIDIAGSWTISKNFSVRGGINNVFDRDPPISAQVGAGFGNGNTFPQVYDALGRRVFMNLTATF